MNIEETNEEINDISKDTFDLPESTDMFDHETPFDEYVQSANDPLFLDDSKPIFGSIGLVIAPKLKDKKHKTCPGHEPGYKNIAQTSYKDFLDDRKKNKE